MLSTFRTSARNMLGLALIAASLAVVTALALRYVFALPMPAELFADQATTRVPLPLFDALLGTFGSATKHLYLIGALLTEAILTALVGVGYVGARALLLRRATAQSQVNVESPAVQLGYADIPALMFALWFFSAAALAPLIGGGFLGVELTGGALRTLLSQLAPDLVFAASLVWQSRALQREQAPAQRADAQLSRRALLRQGAWAAGTLGGGIALWQALTSGLGALIGTPPAGASASSISLTDIPTRISPPPIPSYTAFAPVAGQTAEVTPANTFYFVSKNLAGDPVITASSWRLAFTGMVNAPYSLTYDQLRALPQVTQYHTLECISNEVGGNLMSSGFFTGVRLADALNAAGIQRGATEVIFKAADGYSDSLHLSQALDDRSLIAYLLDGQPLPTLHGFPARLLIPGLYGMKNGKWLTELSVSAGAYAGYWEQRGWSPEAVVNLTSRIDTPHDGDLLSSKPLAIAGIAYAGDKGIARVDVSVDSGKSWKPALMRRPLGALTWALWEYPWTPSSGEQVIIVRAIDLAGNVQTPYPASPLPNGATGYHAITVTVR